MPSHELGVNLADLNLQFEIFLRLKRKQFSG
jgi:hypothetical protein